MWTVKKLKTQLDNLTSSIKAKRWITGDAFVYEETYSTRYGVTAEENVRFKGIYSSCPIAKESRHN